MPQFDVEEYKKQLLTSHSYETCNKVPSPKLEKDTRYIFISYSHKDYKQVYCDLAQLYNSDIPFWYDGGLPAGKNWDDVVRERMTDPRCAGIIFYISEQQFLSDSIPTEILIACGKDAKGSAFQTKRDYFCVNLTEMAPSKILTTVFAKKQFPDTEDGMVSRFNWVEILSQAFPDKATFLSFTNPHHNQNLIEQIGINFGISPNYNPYHFGDALFRSGNGIIEFPNGSVYSGAFLDGKFSGQGTMTYWNGAVYSGTWQDGKFNGHGIFTSSNGTTYVGEWQDGEENGHGIFTSSDGTTYNGKWRDGKKNGHGIFTFPDGGTYAGEWQDGKQNGHGTFTFPDGTTYDGEWQDGKQNGHGTFRLPDGTTYDGTWSDGEQNGHGTLTFPDGATYVGGWGENGSAGFGTYIYPDGASRSGTWDGTILLEGEGVMRYPDGSSYEGQIKNNLRHGRGRYILTDGTVQEGQFENDEFIGPST